ncbi:hypothetical protein VUJ46_02470 [Chryseobacterium sp. MYb264]|uniref:hypothetical protein n=1 Tax=Chryseobacterium sp. MYb264 TaxID=2745153 RepID=UPI002E158F0D|nr:hypothetical protein VUJ46_02470 [Chryseobacterium sp. MYb264]
MFNYFANGGSVDGLSFNKGYAIWSTMDDAKSNMYYDGDQMLSGDTGGISFHRAKFSSDFSQTMSNISWLANTLIGAGATANIPGTGAFRHNEIWHVTKTKGTSFVWQDRWRNPGAKYWRGQQVRAYEPAKRLGNKLTKARGVLLAADIAMSGEVKPSHAINAFMLGISRTGIGSIVAGAWFVADMGTGGSQLFKR